MKKIYSFAAFILAINSVNAKQVLPNSAQQVAENYIRQNTKTKNLALTLSYTEKSSAGESDYYVFDINNHSGFVIVSAEDAGHPIIGYSTESAFVKPSATENPNFYFWMEKRKKEIEFMRNNNIQADSEIKNEWTGYSTNKFSPPSVNTVTPLCQAIWDQGSPYNGMCPGNSYTGCVATAMAIIMKYWSYPAQGNGQSSYASAYGTLSANYGATTYNWANMPVPYGSGSDVAKIMYHCGVSVEMMYSPSGSGAYVCDPVPSAENAYKTYFKYDPGLHCADQTAYTTSAWIQLLESELNAGRPFNYQGVDPVQGGHVWVCDGFDASNNFHMNWGWSGYQNGYFAVTALQADGMTFSQEMYALIGIKPLGATGIADATSVNSINVYPNPVTDFFTIEGKSVEKIHYTLYDALGTEIKSADIFSNGNRIVSTVQLNDIASGIYFLQLNGGNNIVTKKLNINSNR